MTARALVIGAGPAGLGAATRLAAWCDKVTVLDARPRTDLRHAGEHLPPAGIASLSGLGLAHLLDDPRHGESPGVCSIWGSGPPATRDYFFTLQGRGVNLDRQVFDAALLNLAADRGVVVKLSTRLAALHKCADEFRAVLRGPGGCRTMHSDIVIDASGRQARAARLLGGTPDRLDRLTGIVGRIEDAPCAPDSGTLHIEAVEHGWWYSVPYPTGARICAFMTDAPLIRGYPGGASALWRAQLARSRLIRSVTRTGRGSGRVVVFDAATQTLTDPACDGFLAVGDAAMAFDPLSSAGIAKALADGHDAAHALERYACGQPEVLRAHFRKRQQSFDTYRLRHAGMYSIEDRWPDSAFWQARRGMPALHHRQEEHQSC